MTIYELKKEIDDLQGKITGSLVVWGHAEESLIVKLRDLQKKLVDLELKDSIIE